MILAIDPSIANTGWAVVRVPTTLTVSPKAIAALYVESGMVYTEPSDDLASRLAYLARECAALCDRFPIRRAYIEIPQIRSTYRRQGDLGPKAREAILGGDLAQMHRATGAILAGVGVKVPSDEFKAGTTPKATRQRIVLGYWPGLEDRPADELDALYHATTIATDARRKWAA